MGDMEGAAAGRDLNRVVYMLRSARMEDKFRQLRAGTLLAELRSAVSLVHTGGAAISDEARLRLTFSVRSLGLAASLRELLEAMLNTETSGGDPAALYRYLVFRSNTLRDLRQFLDKFRSLAPYVQLQDAPHLLCSSSSSPALHNTSSHDRYRDGIVEPMVGRSELVDKMVSILLSADRSGDAGLCVMPIVGGPGVGKSRLAKAVLHDDRVKHKFGVRLVVPVTQNFSRRRIYVEMVSPHRLKDVQTSPEAMADQISTRLNGGGYLVVLDDVWSDNQENWREVGAVMRALPPSGRVVLTTRTPDIASKLATIVDATDMKPFYLKPLEPEFTAWFVARWMTTYYGDWPTELIRKAGIKIAEKCGGVPLLLDYLRQFFCQPLGLQFWKGLLEQENSGSKIHPDMFWPHLLAYIDRLPSDKFWLRFLRCSRELQYGKVISESASVSYKHLSYDLQKCLLYCSMFPSDFDFDLELLTDLLAAQGSLSPVVAKAQRKGFLKQLLDECFYLLQDHEYGDKTTYRMHKVLHIFAQSMRRETSSVIRVGQLAQFANKATAQIPTSVRCASLVVNPSTASFPRSLFACNDLEALILLQEGAMHPHDQPRCEISEIPQEFTKSFRSIRALSFSGTKIRMLPKFLVPYHMKYLNLSQTPLENIPSSISRLLFLQTLILSYCDKLQKLHPNITNLTLLQKLDLEGCCNLVELPPDMCKMKSLEYLNITQCSSLTRLPRGMGQLKSLQILLGYIVYYYSDGSSMSELQPLANLHRLNLQSLEKVSDLSDLITWARLEHKTRLESLSLHWNMDDFDNTETAYEVLEYLRPHRGLKALEIVAYQGKKPPSWMSALTTTRMGTTEPYLKALVEIKLINMRSCKLPPLGVLPCLKIAEISGAETICDVNDSFYGKNGTFPSLEKLTFSYMHNLEVWEQAHRTDMFPRLAELTVIQCPKLRALHMELPSVEKLTLWMDNKVLNGLKGALRGLSRNLQHISVSFSEGLTASSDCEGLQDLGRLTKLEICGCDELAFLPQGLQRLSSIRSLAIDNCRKLEALPDWLENLRSLQIMRLSGCPLLHSIPGGLEQRSDVIVYVEDCPNLAEEIVS